MYLWAVDVELVEDEFVRPLGRVAGNVCADRLAIAAVLPVYICREEGGVTVVNVGAICWLGPVVLSAPFSS